MYTELPALDEDIGKIHAMVKEKLELATEESVRLRAELARVEEKYKNLKARYNAWWAKLEAWTEKQTKKICALCHKERPLSSPVPLMATHLAASMDHLVGIAAVTPSHLSRFWINRGSP
jgi:hypothetical protein